MPAEPDELLTVKEVAKQLKLNEMTVRNWLERGELAGLRLGSRRVRIRASALDDFIAESSGAQAPDTREAERAYAQAVEAASAASSDAERATALRSVSEDDYAAR